MQPTGMKPEGMKQQMDSIEMKNQGAPTPAPMPVEKNKPTKVKVKKNKLMQLSEFKKMNPSANLQDYFSYVEKFEKSGK
jgi:hypothetical protein